MSHEYDVSATFMGFPVQGFSIDRKPGVTSDTGYIDLPTELVKKIVVEPEFRLWQSANIKEPAGPFNPETARKLSRPTVFTEQPAKVAGLVRGGNLKITTKKAGQATPWLDRHHRRDAREQARHTDPARASLRGQSESTSRSNQGAA